MEEGKKLSVEYCKLVLSSNGGRYSDEEVKKIRDILYILAQLDYMIIKDIWNGEANEKGNSLREGLDG